MKTVVLASTEVPETVAEFYAATRKYFSREGAVLARDGGFGACRYRGTDGAKCAVGCHIPDELYQEDMEGNNFEALLRNFPKLGEVFSKEARGFLNAAQRLHDIVADDAEDFVRLLDGLYAGWRVQTGSGGVYLVDPNDRHSGLIAH